MNDDGTPMPTGDQGTTPTGGQAAPGGGQAAGGQTDPAAGTQATGGQHADPVVQQAPAPAAGQAAGGGQAQGDGQAAAPAAQAAQPATATPAEAEENYLRPRPPDSELGIGAAGDFSTSVQVPAHPNTNFDEAYFLKMLSGSISLTKNEKKKIVESIPKLSQFQIDELIKIFEEERRKFAELDEKHQVKIRELQNKQAEDWKDLEMAEQQEGKSEEDAAAAEALKAQLMGGGDAPQAPAQDQQPPAQAA